MQFRGTLFCGGITLISAFITFSPSISATPQSGIASVYSNEKTANGEYAYPTRLTAAHRTLPFGTFVEVTNKHNGRSVIVRINDRGPFIAGRIIDLTPAGAKAIGSDGLAPVTADGARRHRARGQPRADRQLSPRRMSPSMEKPLRIAGASLCNVRRVAFRADRSAAAPRGTARRRDG